MKPRHRISAALIPFLLLLPLGVPAHADDDPTPEPTVTTTPTEDPSEPPCPEESEEPCPDLSEPPPTPTPTLDPSPEVIAGTTPKLSSPVRVGTKVTSASETGWTAGAALARQWNINGAPVKGETGTLYTPRDTDYGKTLTLTITGSRDGYAATSLTSAGTVVGYGVFDNAPAPGIKGTVRVNSTLSVNLGMWAPAPSKFTYQWKADGKAISKATGSTFKLTSAQRNKKITVTVTASKTAYTSKTMTSRATGKVAPQPPKYQTPAGLRNINYDGVPGFGGCGFNLTPGMNGLKVQMVADKLGVRQGFQSMSPLLRSRVKRFQASRRIPATGVVDKRTWTAMGFSAASWTGIDCYKRGLRINRDSTRAQIINAFVATSMEYRGRRYIWGGANTPSQGADCSGMIIQALYSIGINPNPNNTVNHALPAWRSSRNMYALSGLRHVPISKVQRGDIVFYAMGGRAINHVAVYIGNGQIIEELPGGGRISGLRSHRGLQAQAVRPVP